MVGIAWSDFSWDAFATILTGVLAVGAAAWVGRRQLEIMSRQNDILSRQAQLADLTLRHDLFERRYGVYADVRDFLYFIVTQAAYPDRELETKLFQAIGLSRFYFGAAVHDQLEVIRRRSGEFGILKHEMERLFELEHHYGPGNPERERELLVWVNDQLQNLPDLFGEAMRLGG